MLTKFINSRNLNNFFRKEKIINTSYNILHIKNLLKLNNHKSSSNFYYINKYNFCQWERIQIPIEKIECNYSRSSGPGGQNVNKLNTKVELRFNVNESDWLTKEAKERLRELYPNKINNEGFFILTCQEHRTQVKNKKEAMKKLQEFIDLASMPKKERVIEPFTETKEMEDRRIKEKKMRSDVKKMRNNSRDC